MNKPKIDYTLYLVTDRGLIGNRDFLKCIEQAILGGVTLVQLREKNVSTLEFYNLAVKTKKLTAKYNIPLIINDRIDIALAVDADGVHIGQEDMPLSTARNILGSDKIIGVSCFNVKQAIAAAKATADYLGIGAVFPTSTKSDAKYVSIEELKQIKQNVNIPVVAIGGIDETNVKKLIPTDIDGISVVSAILQKQDILSASKKLLNTFNEKEHNNYELHNTNGCR